MGKIRYSFNENYNYNSPPKPQFLNRKELYKTLNALSPHSREVLVLYYFEDYTPKEIAQKLKISRRAVYGRLATAKNKLKKILEKF